MTEQEDKLDFYAEGGQRKDGVLAIVNSLKVAIEKSNGTYFHFKIKVKE